MKKKPAIYILILIILISIFNFLMPIKVLAATGNDIVSEGKKYLGKPYVYGAAGPNSFDCSGFAQYVYKQLNLALPRTTYTQINAGISVTKDQLKPGDLVFTAAYHVGIYVGNNQIIHAPQENDVVKISTIWNFYAARRIIKDDIILNNTSTSITNNTTTINVATNTTINTNSTYITNSTNTNTLNNNINSNLNSPLTAENLVFDYKFYADKYPDLKNAFGYDKNKLLVHWKTYGIKEGRASSEVLDLTFYLNSHPDLIKVYGQNNYKSAYNHFITWGYKQNRKSSPIFDMAYYKNKYPNLKNLNNNLQVLQDFLTNGMTEGRNASAAFDPKIYAKNYPSLIKTLGNNYKAYYDHYLTSGISKNLKGI